MADSVRRSDRVAGQEPLMTPTQNPESILRRSNTKHKQTTQQPHNQPTDATPTAISNTVQWNQTNAQTNAQPVNLPTAPEAIMNTPIMNTPTFHHINAPMFQTPSTTSTQRRHQQINQANQPATANQQVPNTYHSIHGMATPVPAFIGQPPFQTPSSAPPTANKFHPQDLATNRQPYVPRLSFPTQQHTHTQTYQHLQPNHQDFQHLQHTHQNHYNVPTTQTAQPTAESKHNDATYLRHRNEISYLRHQNEQLESKLHSLESSINQVKSMETSVQSILNILQQNKNDLTTKPQQPKVTKTQPNDSESTLPPFVTAFASKPPKSSPIDLTKDDDSSGISYGTGTDDRSRPAWDRKPAARTEVLSQGTEDSKHDTTDPSQPEIEILAEIMTGTKEPKFPTLSHTKASSKTSMRSWTTAVCSAINQSRQLKGALLPAAVITEDTFLNPNMTTSQKHTIFNAMYKSFDTDVTNYLNMQFNETIQMDALVLWKRFQEAYEKKKYDELEQETLKKKYQDLVRNKEEEMNKYIIRYQNVEQELRENGLESDIKKGKMKAYKFIFSLRDTSHADIVQQIVSGTNTDYNTLSFQAISRKLQSLQDIDKELNWYKQQKKKDDERHWEKIKHQFKRHTDNGIGPGQINTREQSNPYLKKLQGKLHGNEDPSQTKITEWTGERKPLRNGKHVKDFEYEIYKPEANVKTILAFANKMPESCYCHPTARHKFLSCSLVRDICKKCNKEGILNQAISVINGKTTDRINPAGGDSTKTQKLIENAQAKRISALETKLSNLNTTMSQVANIVPKLDSIQNLVETTFGDDEVPTALITNMVQEMEDTTNQEIGEITTEVTSNNSPVNAYQHTLKNVVAPPTIQTPPDNHHASILKAPSTTFPQNSKTDTKSKAKVKFHESTTFEEKQTAARGQSFFNSFPVGEHSKIWFAKVTNTGSHSQNKNKTTADSGATHDMNGVREQFEEIFPLLDKNGNKPQALLGDNHTTCDIEGYGYVRYTINGYPIRKLQLFVPALGKGGHLTSILQHSKYQGCYFHSEANKAYLAFPNKILKATCDSEITLEMKPLPHDAHVEFDEETALLCNVKESTVQTYSAKLVNPITSNLITEDAVISKMSNTVKFTHLTDNTFIPTRQTEGSAGYDVKSPVDYTLRPNDICKIPLNFALDIPEGMYARIADRSSLATAGITVKGGVIDRDYRGNVTVCLRNDTQENFSIAAGSRIAQIIFECNGTPEILATKSLTTTTRGQGGFGSTNNKNQNRKRTNTYRIDDKQVIIATDRNRKVKAKLAHIPVVEDYDQPEEETELPNVETINEEDMENGEQDTPTDHIHQSVHMIPPDAPALDSIPRQNTPTNTPVDRVNSALPKVVSLTRDRIRQATGYVKSDALIKNIKNLGTNSVQVNRIFNETRLDEGSTASMRATNRNTTPVQLPRQYSDAWHMDIGFGPCTAIGGVTHCLYLVDRKTRTQFAYPLKNVTTSLHTQIKRFISEVGVKPKTIYTDFDPKLMNGTVAAYLEDNQIIVQAAPPEQQHKNGLVERNWQTLVSMTRNWLRSQLLPSKFWWFGIKRAVELQNVLPIKLNGIITTPYEATYGRKVDYRCLFPMFSLAYIRTTTQRIAEATGRKWKGKTLKCIVVGKCPKSDGLLFYHPPSKQTLTCGQGYKFDMSHPSGPEFDLVYDNKFIFNTKSSTDYIHRPPTHEQNKTVYVLDPTVNAKDNNTYVEATVLNVPINDSEEHYRLQIKNTGDIVDIQMTEIKEQNPNEEIDHRQDTQRPFPTIPWIKNDAKATLYLPNMMSEPKQGYLKFDEPTEQWHFHPGRKKTSTTPTIHLRDFDTLAQSMVQNKKIFQGWKTKRYCLSARVMRAKANIIARHVSAQNLSSPIEPSLCKHHELPPGDRITWDASYKEEYDGLVKLDTWDFVTEEEYEKLKPIVGKALPSMAISTIKRDGDGKPVRAKYRIVALGNLDPHNWDKSECFAPVLSQPELRLLTAIATQAKRKLKSADVSQAFCQSYLPENEQYFVRPPHGCKLTPKGMYWRLKKTLYGLKRSPRHWYEKCRSILLSIGFKQCPNAPCLFVGNLIEGEPPLYIGIYVDDFAYFSESDEVEQKFEEEFGKRIKTKFNGVIDYFLGIKFTYKNYQDGTLSCHLSQEAFTDTLVNHCKLDSPHVTTPHSPYRSGLPVDKLYDEEYDSKTQKGLTAKMQHLIGCLTWLSTSTRPDISTITNILAKYLSKPTKAHIDAAKRVVRYLKGTRTYGIGFKSSKTTTLQTFVKFPIPNNKITALTDANWGPQDQSKLRNKETIPELELFKSRSISGFLIWYGGPVHWVSKRQAITARSSAEAEIYATDECVKFLQYLTNIIKDLGIEANILKNPINLYNDNGACVNWSKNLTTKGLRHIQMRENSIREQIKRKLIDIQHIPGIQNLSDMFTKEDKDTTHFTDIRDSIMQQQP